MNRISFLNRGYAFKGLLAVYKWVSPDCINDKYEQFNGHKTHHKRLNVLYVT